MTKAEELEALAKGEGCLGRSQDDEPVFILVARDKFAAGIVRKWAQDVMTGTRMYHEHSKIASALVLADEMDAWRERHGGGKVPD